MVGWWTRANDRSDESHLTWAVASSEGSLVGTVSVFGFTWQIGVALIPGMAAREVAVGALGLRPHQPGGDVPFGRQVVAQRRPGLPGGRAADGVGGDERVAVAVAADP